MEARLGGHGLEQPRSLGGGLGELAALQVGVRAHPAVRGLRVGAREGDAAGTVEPDEAVAGARLRLARGQFLALGEGALGDHRAQVVGALGVRHLQGAGGARVGDVEVAGEDRDDLAVRGHRDGLAAHPAGGDHLVARPEFRTKRTSDRSGRPDDKNSHRNLPPLSMVLAW